MSPGSSAGLGARDPLVRYTFEATEGTTVLDRAPREPALDLQLEGAERIFGAVGFEEVGDGVISPGPATELIDRIRSTGELTLVVHARPDIVDQAGPARIVSLGANFSDVSFGLFHGTSACSGALGSTYHVRVRRPSSASTGCPSLVQPQPHSIEGRAEIVAYTHDVQGTGSLYVDGALVTQTEYGTFEDAWDPGHVLRLGREGVGPGDLDDPGAVRQWLGTIFEVAIFDVALSPDEVVDVVSPAASPP